MQSSERLPIRSTPQNQPLKRHNTVRHYANRIRESLTTRVSKTICIIFLSLLLVVGIVLFILYISFRPHRPRIFINEFSIPGLAQPAGFENAKITFNVTVRNSNQHVGIYYYSAVGSVLYRDKKIGATPLADTFFQKPKTTTILGHTLSGAALTVNNQRWNEFRNDRRQGKIAFRLEIKTIIRFQLSTWDSRRHTMHVNCDVVVGTDGLILPAYKDKRCPLYFT